ncbi:UNVERIFIED_CONTAM: hypothetical protein Slati_0890000 [Sesamum latifolium]|uniref:DUF4283 domain-containing protein n=1 Tax=Sesamum latifolium TaxID=2727402 RepID=A0AAW2XNP8_9LAMI
MPFAVGISSAHQEGEVNPSVESSPTFPDIFIGKVPLRSIPPIPPPENKFVKAFHNSTHRTLQFIPPERQNGEVVVRPTMAMVHAATVNGFFFITFKTIGAMDDAIDGGPWLFQGHPLVLQQWEIGLALRKDYTQVPVWIKLCHLPVEFWTEDGLSTVASGVGKPLYPDSITKACTRLDFARVCVMLDYDSTLPKHIVVVTPMVDGSEAPCRVDIEYEWIPAKCVTCCALGHSTSTCPATKKPTKPPVKVFVQKTTAKPPVPPSCPPVRVQEVVTEAPT